MPGIVPQSEYYGLPEREASALPPSGVVADILRPTGIPSGTMRAAGAEEDYAREEREFWRRHVKDTGPGIGDEDDEEPPADDYRRGSRVAKGRGMRECINCGGSLSGEEDDDKEAECGTCGMSAHEKGVDWRKHSSDGKHDYDYSRLDDGLSDNEQWEYTDTAAEMDDEELAAKYEEMRKQPGFAQSHLGDSMWNELASRLDDADEEPSPVLSDYFNKVHGDDSKLYTPPDVLKPRPMLWPERGDDEGLGGFDPSANSAEDFFGGGVEDALQNALKKRKAVNTRGMDPDDHAYHTELPHGPGPGREWNPDFREYEPSDEDERRQEAVGEDDESGYNWGPEPKGRRGSHGFQHVRREREDW